MWEEKSVHCKIETGFAFKHHIIDVYAEAFINQTFHQDGSESAVKK